MATLTLGWPSVNFAVEDAIIAVVNDELITLKDLRDYARSTYVSLVAEGIDDTQIQAIMKDMEIDGINKLIEDKLILSRANKAELAVREELIDARISEMALRYGSKQNLVNALIKSGATLTDLRNKIRDQMKIKFIVRHEVKSKVHINPQQVTDFYEQNKDKFSRGERANLESIFITYNDDKAVALTKAGEALKQINEGGNFEETAQKYSQAPSIGIIERGQLLPLIEDAIFGLDINEISSLVETDNGVYIFKLIAKSPARIANLEDVKEAIHESLSREEFKNALTLWLEKLKEEAYIEIKQ